MPVVALPPGIAAGVREGGFLQLCLQQRVVLPRDVFFGRDGECVSADPGLEDRIDDLREVADLRFDHQDEGVVREVRVGPVEDAEVRELRHRDAFVGVGGAGPEFREGDAVAACDFHGREEGHRLEACGEDDGVVFLWGVLVGEFDAVGGEALDLGGCQADVWAGERGIVVVGDDGAFATG